MFVSVAEAKNRLTVYLAQARKNKEPIIVTHHGKPYALIQPISEEDLEGLGPAYPEPPPKGLGRRG
jgi:prevent-host-death family protein